ncbi:hypothetical protein GCM10023174_01880 [Chelativorans composti]
MTVGIRMDRDRRYSHPARRPNDPDSDLATVRNQNFAEHLLLPVLLAGPLSRLTFITGIPGSRYSRAAGPPWQLSLKRYGKRSFPLLIAGSCPA